LILLENKSYFSYICIFTVENFEGGPALLFQFAFNWTQHMLGMMVES
jgi:hypothetical protein